MCGNVPFVSMRCGHRFCMLLGMLSCWYTNWMMGLSWSNHWRGTARVAHRRIKLPHRRLASILNGQKPGEILRGGAKTQKRQTIVNKDLDTCRNALTRP